LEKEDNFLKSARGLFDKACSIAISNRKVVVILRSLEFNEGYQDVDETSLFF